MRTDPHGHSRDEGETDPTKNYDTRDYGLSTGLVFAFVVFMFAAVTALISLGFYRILVPKDEARTTSFPLPKVRALPPDPRLQANPIEDIKTFRTEERAELEGYRRDPKTGEIHIPVARAMDLITQEGLPTRSTPGKQDTNEPNEPSTTSGQAPTQAEVAGGR